MDLQLSYETYRLRHPSKVEALYHALKDAITDGRLPHGSRLPATRELAVLYGLSRGTVNTVYETLASEGYLLSKVGKGTEVAFQASSSSGGGGQAAAIRLSDWGARTDALALRTGERELTGEEPSDEIRFEVGTPELRDFPFEHWNKCLYAEVRAMGSPFQQEPFAAQGHRGLREAVAAYLKRSRGVSADPEQVVIVNGSMQAIAFLCQLLLNPGDRVAFEDPGYSGIRRAASAAGGEPVPLPVGPGFLPGVRASGAKLLFVSPGRQFPTGTVLSMSERLGLLEWAAETGAVLVEDDYDSEFRHRGRPLEPLKALDRSGSAVYTGTFSKTLPPGHRIGYVLLPEALAGPFAKTKQLYEPHPTALLEQRALARFMQSGQFERHLRRMKRIYGARYHVLKQALQEQLGDCMAPVPSDCGLHIFTWWTRSEAEWIRFRNGCHSAGVFWTETEGYFAGKAVPSACFGFSHLEEDRIAAGVAAMARVWQAIRD